MTTAGADPSAVSISSEEFQNPTGPTFHDSTLPPPQLSCALTVHSPRWVVHLGFSFRIDSGLTTNDSNVVWVFSPGDSFLRLPLLPGFTVQLPAFAVRAGARVSLSFAARHIPPTCTVLRSSVGSSHCSVPPFTSSSSQRSLPHSSGISSSCA